MTIRLHNIYSKITPERTLCPVGHLGWSAYPRGSCSTTTRIYLFLARFPPVRASAEVRLMMISFCLLALGFIVIGLNGGWEPR